MIDLIQHIEQGGTLIYVDTNMDVRVLSFDGLTINIAGIQTGSLAFNRWGFHKRGTSLRLTVKENGERATNSNI